MSITAYVCVITVNVHLSLDETYADVMPVRMDPDSPSAFVYVSPIITLTGIVQYMAYVAVYRCSELG